MKRALLGALLLIGACAPTQPYPPPTTTSPMPPAGGSGTTSSRGVTTQTVPANSYSQDAVECERRAALSQAGSKGEAFANCMRSRGHAPGR